MIDKKISNYVKPLTYTYIRCVKLNRTKTDRNRKNNKWIKGEDYEWRVDL